MKYILFFSLLGLLPLRASDPNSPVPTIEETLPTKPTATQAKPIQPPTQPPPVAKAKPNPAPIKQLDDLMSPDAGPVIWQQGGLHPHAKVLITLLGVSQVHLLVELDDNGYVDLLFLTQRRQNFLNLTTLDVTNKIKTLLQAENWNGYTVNISQPAEPPL